MCRSKLSWCFGLFFYVFYTTPSSVLDPPMRAYVLRGTYCTVFVVTYIVTFIKTISDTLNSILNAIYILFSKITMVHKYY